jgi:thioredoxin 1
MEIDVNDNDFKQEVLNATQVVLVDFWAEWCGPCRMIAPMVAQIASEYKGKLKVCKINVDNAPQTASAYGIMSIPTLAIFKKGKIVETFIGALSKSALDEKIKKYV